MNVIEGRFGSSCSTESPEADHDWAVPFQPTTDAAGRPYRECLRCGVRDTKPFPPPESNAVTDGPGAFPGTHDLPEFGELP